MCLSSPHAAATCIPAANAYADASAECSAMHLRLHSRSGTELRSHSQACRGAEGAIVEVKEMEINDANWECPPLLHAFLYLGFLASMSHVHQDRSTFPIIIFLMHSSHQQKTMYPHQHVPQAA